MFGGAIIKRAEPGAPIFQTLGNENMNRALRANYAGLGFPEADRYSPHSFRRGTAGDIMNSGSSLSEIMRTAGWYSSRFRAYLDIQKAEERATRSVLAAEPSASSDDTAPDTSSATSNPTT